MTPPRLPDWHDRLAAFIHARLMMPFAWGANDCVMFAGAAVHAETAWHPFATYQGQYSTPTGAYRILARGGGLAPMVSELLGPPIAPRLVRDGDVGLVLDGGQELLALRIGVNWLAPTERGLGTLRGDHAVHGWRIG